MVNTATINAILTHELYMQDATLYPEEPQFQEQAKLSSLRLMQLYQEEFNIMATEFLEDKINHLKQQVRQEKMSIFQFDLAIADAQAGATGNATVDEQLKVTAQSNELGKIMSVRKLAIREALLAQLEAEFEATKSGN